MNVREYLTQGRPLLFDGAMGTLFAARQCGGGGRCELANLECPQEISAIHTAYLKAGCRAIRTNTFDVSRELLEDAVRGAALIEAGCTLALEAAAPYEAAVFADLGPAPEAGALSRGACYIKQAELFLKQGLTCFVAETLPTDDGLEELARYLKERCPEAFLLVSFAVGADGITQEGLSGRELFCRAAQLPEVDAVGFNCMSGPRHLLAFIRSLDLKVLGGKPLSVMPNAGYPTVLGRRVVYQGKAGYFAGQMAEIVKAGATIVGGCCGTTPEHIALTGEALANAAARPAVTVDRGVETHPHGPQPNPFQEKLAAGKRVIAVELDPPTNDDVEGFVEGVRALRDAGADAITISDCPVGRPRADSSLLACKLRRELGIEPIPHMTCRDRNLNATKALLLGLSMEGVHNVLLVTGDPVPTEDRDEVKSVFNFNARKLIRYVASLEGNGLTTPFQIFAALNVNAPNFTKQLELAQEKEAAGAAGFLTQPVHSPEALENLKRARETLKGKLLGGIFPVVSHRNAMFLNNEVAGVRVPEEMVAKYEGKSREEAEALALELSVQIAGEMAPWIDGFYLMTPFRRLELMRQLIAAITA